MSSDLLSDNSSSIQKNHSLNLNLNVEQKEEKNVHNVLEKLEKRCNNLEKENKELRSEMTKIKRQLDRPRLYQKIFRLDWIYKLMIIYLFYCVYDTAGAISEIINRITQFYFLCTIIRDTVTFSVDQKYLIQNNPNNLE